MRTCTYSLLIAVMFFYSCQEKQQQKEQYLKTVLNNLNEIKSAKYYSQKEAWDPGDTVANYIVDLHAIEYVNDADTTIGSQFTSVHCGPCTASIPYLNKLKASYDEGDLKLIAIESYSKNSNVLEGYSRRNNFNYTFLHSEPEVNDAYSITFTPIFFLLDEKYVVKKVFAGYSGQETNEKISKVIDELLL